MLVWWGELLSSPLPSSERPEPGLDLVWRIEEVAGGAGGCEHHHLPVKVHPWLLACVAPHDGGPCAGTQAVAASP